MTAKFMKTFIQQGPKLWLELPANIKAAKSLKSFTCNLKDIVYVCIKFEKYKPLSFSFSLQFSTICRSCDCVRFSGCYACRGVPKLNVA